jgi:ankyrin repeat protein
MNDDNAAQLLIDAIDQNDIATASLLISSSSGSGSVNLNAKPWPLHRATEHGRLEIMTMLLDAVADINAVDGYYRTACRVAIWNNQFDALKLLVERGADLNVADVKGGSLLSMVAQSKKNEQFVILLLDAGAPIDGLSILRSDVVGEECRRVQSLGGSRSQFHCDAR